MKQVSKEQIQEWKAKYDDVYKVVVDDKVCYLRSPDRKTLSYAGSVGKTDPVKFNEIILKACWLAGDEEIKTVDKYFLGVSAKISEIIEVKEAKLEKL